MASIDKAYTATRQSVVVEIASDWLKIIHVEPSKGGVRISKMHLEHVDDSSHDLPKRISEALKKNKFPSIPVIVCVPRQMVNVKILELPSINPDEIRDMVDLQSAKQTPYSKDEVVSDYRIIGHGRPGYTRIMLVIVQKSILRHRYMLLEDAGVGVEKMSVGSEGMANLLTIHSASLHSAAGATVLLDVDSASTDLIISSRQGMLYTRNIMIGAAGLLSDYDKFRDKFTLEVGRSIEMCQAESPAVKIDKVMLTGAGSNIPGLAEHIGKMLNVSAEAVDATKFASAVPQSPSLKAEPCNMVSITPLTGMAAGHDAIQVSLIPDSVKMRKGLLDKARAMSLLGILTLAVLLSFSMFSIIKISSKKTYLGALEAEIKKTDPVVQSVESMADMIRLVKVRQDSRTSTINIISLLQKHLPEKVYVESVELDLNEMKGSVSGIGNSRADITTYKKSLENTKLFTDVKPEGAIEANQDKKFTFKLIFSVGAGQ